MEQAAKDNVFFAHFIRETDACILVSGGLKGQRINGCLGSNAFKRYGSDLPFGKRGKTENPQRQKSSLRLIRISPTSSKGD